MRFQRLLYLIVGGTLALAQPKPAEPAFEVASIKASLPPAGNGPIRVGIIGGPGTQDPLHATFTHFRLASLISFAYDLKLYQFDLENARLQNNFEVEVKMPEGSTREQFRAMMRNLLAERFHLVVHLEKRPTDVYDLVQAKGGHKLKPPTTTLGAQPAGFIPAEKGADGLPKIPPGVSRQICAFDGCRWQLFNANLDRLVSQLAAELRAPIIDRTGITGNFDYSLGWGSSAANADVTGPPPLATAINDQLGLRVEKRRGEIDYLIVDSVDKTPTEN